MRTVRLFLLALILVTLEACVLQPYPLYQPISQGSIWNRHQGYFEYQIDSRTYLIGYSRYIPDHPLLTGTWRVRSKKRLIKGSQQYALFRAAEFTKAHGRQSFIVLHKDDWFVTGYETTGSGKYRARRLRVSPGAWVIIRIVDVPTAVLAKDDIRIYSADAVLAMLAQENAGLAAYQGTVASADVMTQDFPIFDRWRSSSSAYDSVPVPGVPREQFWGPTYTKFHPDSTVTQTAPGMFGIAVWASNQISPIEMLLRCLSLARREGYKAFKIDRWTTEEHLEGNKIYRGIVWFRDTVDVSLQHESGISNLEPVFDVDELSSHMDTQGVLLPR